MLAFIMGYVTFSLGCYMVCCSIASLAVGYIYIWVVLIYIHSRLTTIPTPLKSNNSDQGLSVSLRRSFLACCYMKGLVRFVCLMNHSLPAQFISFCRVVFLAVMFYISEFLFCLLYYFHSFCWWMHNKERRTRLVLTHPNCGCLLDDKCFIFVWAG